MPLIAGKLLRYSKLEQHNEQGEVKDEEVFQPGSRQLEGLPPWFEGRNMGQSSAQVVNLVAKFGVFVDEARTVFQGLYVNPSLF